MSVKKLLLRNRGRSLIYSLLLLLCASAACATDSYNGAELTIPSITIGNATYINMMVTVGGIVSGPTGAAPSSNRDIYNPANNQLSIPAVVFGGTTYYNVVITVGNLVSISSVSGADSYNGYDLSIPVVQVLGGLSYTNVAVTIGSYISVAGGMPASSGDTYNPGTNRLSIPAAQYGGKIYTNVSIAVGKILSAGPANAAQGIYSGISADGYYVLGFVQSNGTYWFLYTTVSLPNPMFSLPPVVGIDSGHATYLNGGFSAAIDVGEDLYVKNVGGTSFPGSQVGTFSSSYTQGQSLNGTVAYVPTGTGGTTFSLAYLPISRNAPIPLAQLAGNYTGVFTSTSAQYSPSDSYQYGPPTTTLTITADGGISGPVANACQCAPASVIGSISPRSDIDAYDISLTFVSARFGSYFFIAPGPYTGIAYYDATTGTFTLAAIAPDNSAIGFVTPGPM